MSGFEIAGIVLAAFSIIEVAAKDSRGIIRKARNWWRFGLAFEDFMLRLDTERVAFQQNLTNLLSSTDISEHRKESLMKDVNPELWNDPDVQDDLKRRIGDLYYDWYITVLRDIHQALRETMDLLPIDEIEKIHAGGTANVLFRLKTSFSSRNEKLLNRIHDRNEEISNFLDRESITPEHLTPKLRHSSRIVMECKSLMESQRKSEDLYQSLLSVWKCKCSPHHLCSIGTALHGRNTNIYLLLQDRASISVILTRPPKENSDILIPTEPAQAQTTSLQDISDFRCQVVEENKLKPSSNAKTKGIIKSIIRKRLSGKRVTFSVTAPSPAADIEPSQSLTSTDPAGLDSIISDICDSLRPTTISPETVHIGSISTGMTMTRDKAWELLLLRREAHSEATGGDRLSSFLTKTPSRKKRMEIGLDIALSLLSLSQTWVPPDLEKTFISIFQDELAPQTPCAKTYFSHPQLFSPWRPEFSPAAPGGSAEQARRFLLALGIILLELLFGQTLESQPYRSQFFGPDGKPNTYTDMCTAMEWQKRVELEVGDGIPQAIQRCVECDFGTERDLSNPKFVQAVLDLVVVPVRQFLGRWDSASALAGAASRAATILS